MKNTVKLALSFLILLSLFTSCRSYKLVHSNRDEITTAGGDLTKHRVYIRDKTALYSVDKPNLSIEGVKGSLTPVLNPDTISEIKDPHTRKQLKRRQHDLVVTTKTEVKDVPANAVVLKKADITDITHITSSYNIAEDIGTVAILGLGVVVWVVIVESFQGLL
jgi:hypothetical protein